MSDEKKISSIRHQISKIRKRGELRSFPAELRAEALYLAETYGFKRISEETGISKASLYKWRLEQAKKSPKQEVLEPKFEVTRIIAEKCTIQKQSCLAKILTQANIEVELFDRDLAKELFMELCK